MKNGFFITLTIFGFLNCLIKSEVLNLAEKEGGEKLLDSKKPSFIFFKENLDKKTDSDFKAFKEASDSLAGKAHFILGDPTEITGEVMLEHLDMKK